MAALADRVIAPGDGTPERDWRPWLAAQPLPRCTAGALVSPRQRAVVVAPHPDDEVLAVGGLLENLARLGRRIQLLAVTDGGASHPDSSHWTPQRLLRERPLESAHALALLGVEAPPLRLRLPDGGVAASIAQLRAGLRRLLTPHDVVFTTWRQDGHPDHEATGTACAQAALDVGARLVEVPVWAWHWAAPGDARLPWRRACVLPLDPDSVRRKCSALRAFRSQLEADPGTGAPPVLRDSTVQRAARPFEVLFA